MSGNILYIYFIGTPWRVRVCDIYTIPPTKERFFCIVYKRMYVSSVSSILSTHPVSFQPLHTRNAYLMYIYSVYPNTHTCAAIWAFLAPMILRPRVFNRVVGGSFCCTVIYVLYGSCRHVCRLHCLHCLLFSFLPSL